MKKITKWMTASFVLVGLVACQPSVPETAPELPTSPEALFQSLRRVGGKFGARLLPIVEYSHLGLPHELNREWALLDTFDMYSPAHDHPRSIAQVKGWFAAANFVDVVVEYGPNGVIGIGRRPLEKVPA